MRNTTIAILVETPANVASLCFITIANQCNLESQICVSVNTLTPIKDFNGTKIIVSSLCISMNVSHLVSLTHKYRINSNSWKTLRTEQLYFCKYVLNSSVFEHLK